MNIEDLVNEIVKNKKQNFIKNIIIRFHKLKHY